MGLVVGRGEKFKRLCRSCRELIIIIGSGANICRCPYCGHTLMDHEPDEKDLNLSLDKTHQDLLRFRNATYPAAKLSAKLTLLNRLQGLYDDLEFFGKDQRRWHRWQCSCGWTGYEPKWTFPKNDIKKQAKCPICEKEAINVYSEILDLI